MEREGPARFRSFVLGGLVGAAGTVATLRRVRFRRRGHHTPSGLAAFEQAPCFEETIERERGDDEPVRETPG